MYFYCGLSCSVVRKANITLAAPINPAVVNNAVEQDDTCAKVPNNNGHDKKAESAAILDNDNAWLRVRTSFAMSAAKALKPGFTMELPTPQTKMAGSMVATEAVSGDVRVVMMAPTEIKTPAGTTVFFRPILSAKYPPNGAPTKPTIAPVANNAPIMVAVPWSPSTSEACRGNTVIKEL